MYINKLMCISTVDMQVMEYFGSPWSVEMAAPASRDVGHDKYQSQLISPSLLLSVGSNQGRPTPVRRASCDFFECLEKHERLPEDTARYVFGQLAETVCHLHRKGIVHCDLKVSSSFVLIVLGSSEVADGFDQDENIVIDNEFRVKIIDFGSALLLDPTLPAPFHQKFRGVSFQECCDTVEANL
jgi:serine/threonine protein kinase